MTSEEMFKKVSEDTMFSIKRLLKRKKTEATKPSLPTNSQLREIDLRMEYEDISQEKAVDESGVPTKQFEEWKNRRAEFEYLLYKASPDDNNYKPYHQNSFDERFVDKIAYLISRKETKIDIEMAIDLRGGNQIHGYLLSNFPNHYEYLIENGVLYRALNYAKDYYVPPILHYVSEWDLEKMVINRFELKYAEFFQYSFYGLEFGEVIIVAREQLTTAFYWEQDKIIAINGFFNKVSYAVCNSALLTITEDNIPVFIVLNPAFKTEGCDTIFINRQQKEDLSQELMFQALHYYMTENEPKDRELKKEQLKRLKAEELIEEYEAEQEDIIYDFEAVYQERKNALEQPVQQPKKKINPKNLAILIGLFLVFAIVIIVVLAFAFQAPPSTTPTETIEESSFFFKKILSKFW